MNLLLPPKYPDIYHPVFALLIRALLIPPAYCMFQAWGKIKYVASSRTSTEQSPRGPPPAAGIVMTGLRIAPNSTSARRSSLSAILRITF